eukprot:CAMPEP_0172488918 /NCGR_PEP_ID=MMETSP1066-20121228/18627_1 /TAXON_ID=671091 /ORGANISM="Coscinodiscus wailesii, Strain CCMP2513" /LENGTH=463 /DNA_ID=CAMNT_0013256423 /DNA_START=82 /DNA_END=1473 /DNA_ORIENTATION=+
MDDNDDNDNGGDVEMESLVPRGLLPRVPVDLHPRRSSVTAVSLDETNDDVEDEFDDVALVASPSKQVSHGHGQHGGGLATPRQTVVNIFISFVGAGMLGMPYAFSQSGWALGVICLCAVSTGNIYCMLLVVNTRKQLERNGNKNIEGYGDVGRVVLGERGETFVNICLVISQVGFATAYLIFIAANVTSIFPEIRRAIICYGCVPILSLLVQIRDMALLSPFSLLADVANLSGTTAVFFQDVKAFEHHEIIKAWDFSCFLYVTAVSIYSLEGIGMVLPLESSCVKREDFPKLLKYTGFAITMLISTFGVCGYAAFGSHTMAPVTLNLDGVVASFVKLALCLALYLTYPVMFFPVWLVAPLSPLFRAIAVLATAMVAASVPSFGKFLGLVGASICTLLGFILPAVLHIKVFHYDAKAKGGQTLLQKWEFALDIFLILFGILFGIMGTWSSLVALINHTEDAGHV